MKKSSVRPTWWLLYLSAAVILGLLWMEVKVPLSENGHTWAQAGLVLVLFGLVMTWLRANDAAFLSEEYEKFKKTTITYTLDTPSSRHGDMFVTEINNQSYEPEKRFERSAIPVWMLSWMTVLIAFFKTQDK